MDGGIDLAIKLFVQGENSDLVLEAEDTLGLFFIGGKWTCNNIYCGFVTVYCLLFITEYEGGCAEHTISVILYAHFV